MKVFLCIALISLAYAGDASAKTSGIVLRGDLDCELTKFFAPVFALFYSATYCVANYRNADNWWE